MSQSFIQRGATVSHSGRLRKHLSARLSRRLLVGLIGASLAAGAVLPSTVFAQSTNATLRGTAPPNTEITALNTATGATRHTKSNAQGNYTLVGLPPGTWTVSAGAGAPRTVTLSVASTSTLNLKGGGKQPTTTVTPNNATELQGVQVTAGALPDIDTSQVATTISQHEIETLPQVSRNFLEFADIVPGMKFTVSANGNTSLRAGAQNDSRINVFIDGVSQKSYVMGGGIAGQNASQGNPFPELAIGQYKVITSNYKAEYAQLSSAAITALTKSGTNQFKGEVFDRYTSGRFRARTPAENAANKKTPSHEREFGFDLGGPIVKNLMHFYVTYEGKRFNTPTTVVVPPNGQPGVPFLPSDVASQFGPSNLPFKENLYFGKLDWEPGDNDRIELSARIRNENTRTGFGGATAESAGIDQKNTDRRYVLKWDHSGNSGWFNELLLTHQYTFFRPTPLSFGNGAIYTLDMESSDQQIIDTGPASPLAAQDKGQKGFTLKDDLTLSDFQWHGDHVVKAGIVYRDLTLKAADAGNFNPQFYYTISTDAGLQTTPYKAFFTKPVSGLGLSPTVVTKDRQYGVYIQDDWDVNDNLTLNLGVRWDYEDDPSYTDFVTPKNVIAALNSPNPYPGAAPGETYADALAKGGVNVADYISTGHNRSNYGGEVQPRLGFSYDINADQMHVIHGGAGRSYDRDLYNYMQLETTKAALPQFTVFFRDPATGICHHGGAPCFDWNPDYLDGLRNLQALVSATNKGGEIDLLNNRLTAPYSDKFSVGMANQVGPWRTDATLVRSLYHDGFAFTLGNRYPNGSYFNDPRECNANANPGAAAAFGCPVPGFGSLILGNNGISVRTTQFLVSAKKPFTDQSGWGATLAYTFTHAKQNRDITQHYSFDYATVQDYPFITSNAAPKHRLVATGSLNGPWGLIFGAKLTLATPVPANFIACYGPNSPYGSAGNPPVMFANGSYCTAAASRPAGNGRFLVGGKIFGYRDVDFQVTKNFHLWDGTTLYARFDLLNAFNFKNLISPINDLSGPPGDYATTYNPIGAITYVPRTIKFEMGLKF
jgi:outer membrane receptor protein involved in Fe transport